MNSNKSLLIVMIGLGAVAIVGTLLWRSSPVEVIPSSPVTNVETTTTAPHATELSPIPREPAAEASPSSSSGGARSAEAVLTPDQTWEAKYAGLTSSRLKEFRDELQRQISQQSEPALKKLYDAGQYEVTDQGNSHSVSNEESDLSGLLSIVMAPPSVAPPNGEVRRVVLPEGQYPALYAMKREERWLNNRSSELEQDEMMAKRKQTVAPPK